MSDGPRAAAVLYAKDLERLAAFYVGVAGLQQQVEDDHIVLASRHFELVVLRIPPHIAAMIEIAVPPKRREQTPIKLVFFVTDLAAARSAAASLGGALNDVAQQWTFQGHTVCDGHDPEGKRRPTARPRRLPSLRGRTNPYASYTSP